MGWKKIRTIGILLLLAGGGLWIYWQQYGMGESTRWVTAKVARGDIEESTTALGTLQPLNYVDVGTQVSGQLRKIHVPLGATVREGELLAEIDPTLYATRVEADQAQLQGLKAQLTEKRAQHALAQSQYERQQKMLAANATSQEAYQSALSTLKTTQAQLEQLAAQMRQVESTLRGDEANLGYTRIFAPMNGTVVTLPARQGQTLNANQQAPLLLRIADLSTMTVWTQVSEADIVRLKPDMEAYFTTLGRPEKRHAGRVRQILPTPEVVNNVVLYNALFDVPNPDGELGIQMSAQVSFVHAAVKDTLVIPIAALFQADREKKRSQEKPAGGTVRVLREGKPETRSVELGVKNRLQAQVLSGLQEGEEVILSSKGPEKRSGGSPLSGGHPTAGGRPRP
ncbi:MAG: efflux RND transporter periplasmic adaptor subunit [Magnetococcales bacterium]|nr:efflux RND transporter periplasmic adaptor subunit [Magnetococcales bacterium]